MNFKGKSFQKLYSPIQSNQVQMGQRERGTPNCSLVCLSITGAFMALAAGVPGSGLFLVPLTAPPVPKDAPFHPDTGCCKEQGQLVQEAA